MKTFLLASSLGLLAAAAAGPATAQTTRSFIIEQVKVPHGDLDLATKGGADAMLDRLASAASDACGRKPRMVAADPLGPSKQHIYRLCRVAAIDNATLTLDAPLVRVLWLENDESIRFGDEARKRTSDLFRLAGVDESAGQRRNY